MRKIILFLFSLLICTNAFCASLINDTETEKVLMELVEPLGKAAGIPDNRLKIHIVNSNDFNAFVTGGEDIYVYTGLLTQIKSPNALQAVVAHEMGHTLGGHMVQMASRMDAELKRAMLIQALGVGLMVAGGNPSLGAGVLAGSGGIAQQSMLAFTRDEERIADDLGVDLMIKAGLNPNGFIEVFEQMDEMSSVMESKINPNRVNHPLTTERLKNVKDKINKTENNYKPDKKKEEKQKEEYELVRAKLIGYLDSPEKVKAMYSKNDETEPALYAKAISSMQQGNLDAGKTFTLQLIDKNPENPYFYELLGDLEYQYGHYDDSVIAYEKSLELTDNAPQIETALALVLTERNKPDDKTKAVELCKRSLLKSPSPLTYWVLARAYEDGRSDWALAEYYNMQGDEKNTVKYAKRAMKKLKKDSPEYIKSSDLIK